MIAIKGQSRREIVTHTTASTELKQSIKDLQLQKGRVKIIRLMKAQIKRGIQFEGRKIRSILDIRQFTRLRQERVRQYRQASSDQLELKQKSLLRLRGQRNERASNVRFSLMRQKKRAADALREQSARGEWRIQQQKSISRLFKVRKTNSIKSWKQPEAKLKYILGRIQRVSGQTRQEVASMTLQEQANLRERAGQKLVEQRLCKQLREAQSVKEKLKLKSKSMSEMFQVKFHSLLL